MRWWFDKQTRQHQKDKPTVVPGSNDGQLYGNGGMVANHGGLDKCGTPYNIGGLYHNDQLYTDGGHNRGQHDGGSYNNRGLYDNNGHPTKQHRATAAMVACACVDGPTLDNSTNHALGALIKTLGQN